MDNKKLVAKSNALVDACYSLSVREHQIIAFAAASIPRNDISLTSLDVKINIEEFTEFFGLDKKKVMPNQLLESAKKLYNRSIMYLEGVEEIEMRWIGKRVRNIENGDITLSFLPELIPYLTGLKDRYTLYTIGVIKDFKCQHSFLIYELLAKDRNKDSAVFSISIEQLRKKLCLEDKYPKFHDMKRYAIEPIFADLEACTDLTLSWKLLKKGRTVTHLQIIFQESKEATPPKGSKKQKRVERPSMDELLRRHARPGENTAQATKRIRKELETVGDEHLQEALPI